MGSLKPRTALLILMGATIVWIVFSVSGIWQPMTARGEMFRALALPVGLPALLLLVYVLLRDRQS